MNEQSDANETDPVLSSRDGDVVTLTLNNPAQINALSPEMLKAIPVALSNASTEGARAIVITGAGRGFCSGAQLASGFPAGSRDLGTLVDAYYNPVARALAESPVPIVTALNGVAAGAGASIALAGDLIVAGKSAYISLAFARIGLVPDAGATWLVARAIGRPRTLELALLGEKLMADDALAAGLLNRVVDDAAVLDTAQDFAARLAAMPTATLLMIRRQVRVALDEGFDASLAAEREHQRTAGFTADHVEGVTAFAEKRQPRFTGR